MKVKSRKNTKGIELVFEREPDQEIKGLISKTGGYSFKKDKGHWWTNLSDSRVHFTQQFEKWYNSDQKNGTQLVLSSLYSNSAENYKNNNFSHVEVFTTDGEKLDVVVFDPSKPISAYIATHFVEQELGKKVKKVEAHPKRHKKLVGELLQKKDRVIGEVKTIEAEKKTDQDCKRLIREVIDQLTDIEIDLEGEDELIVAATRLEMEDASSRQGDVNLEMIKAFIEDLREVEFNDFHSRMLVIQTVNRLSKCLGFKPITTYLTKPSGDLKPEPTGNADQKKNQNQHELNSEIEVFIESKDERGEGYDEEDKNYIAQYTGSGGLIKQGAEGKGILYEYYTPDQIVQKMWGLATKYGYRGGDVLEPSCGIGAFLKYAPLDAKVVGYEINPISKRICEISYPHALIHQEPFERIFFKGNIHLKDDFGGAQYDLVIGNPPYGEFSGRWAGMGEKKHTAASTYDQYFITRGLDLLRTNGLLVFIIPSSFLDNNSKYKKLKEKIQQKAELIDAYRLPQGIFKRTDIGTDIIVFKRKEYGKK